MKILFHSGCNDGKGAALAAYISIGDDGVDYIPVQYGYEPPDDLDGHDVIMVDFSYPREVLREIAKNAKSVLVIDHHKTAQADLKEPIEGVTTIFDMEKSGAVLAWEYFHPLDEIPPLFLFIQDRDLWRFEYPETRPLSYGLQLYSDDFRRWGELLDENNLSDCVNEGKIIEDYVQLQARRIAEKAKAVPFLGYMVPMVNLPGFLISDTLHILAKDHPFAISYFDIPHENKRVYSMRSDPGGIDVSALAKNNGGGGHHHAAGFSVDTCRHA